jgi:hypothetical protein
VHGFSFEDKTGPKENRPRKRAGEQLTRNRARERATSHRRARERGERGTRNDEQRMKV